jgi:hypothetical protein
MTLAAGIKLGSYEVLSPIGPGGTGEVYRAHDTKLGRDVAIKWFGSLGEFRFALTEHRMGSIKPLSTWVFLFALISSAHPVSGQTFSAQQQLARDIYKDLVEINTVTATGDTGKAADAQRSAGGALSELRS